MAPVLSMLLDEDVSADIALMYPELYQDLLKVPALVLKARHLDSAFCAELTQVCLSRQ